MPVGTVNKYLLYFYLQLVSEVLRIFCAKEKMRASLRQNLVDEGEDPETCLFDVEPDMEDMQQQMAAVLEKMGFQQEQMGAVLENIEFMREQLNSGLGNANDKTDDIKSVIKTELLAISQRIHAVEERITNIDKQMNQRVDAVEEREEVCFVAEAIAVPVMNTTTSKTCESMCTMLGKTDEPIYDLLNKTDEQMATMSSWEGDNVVTPLPSHTDGVHQSVIQHK
ncbi:uncharacterized protein LOC129925711 [Biomphalaria glabrata]|uniref:Uncharacterized protein LOC129925711 n=1 Tax=Biomphalaria glabrata TaxID=6526 RepID=A0A9W3A3D0_BIOGL|nr:uncharacterized protein LOC129925711 [Biomphalaria glabrata]